LLRSDWKTNDGDDKQEKLVKHRPSRYVD
jgi:hypothetical protein